MAAAADDILRRVPPQNIEAEQSVLGAILLDNDAINQAIEILTAEDFYRESHREIFRAMVALTERNQPVDAITLTDALRTGGVLEAVGGAGYIAELAACVPTAANAGHYARIVREKALLRSLASISTEIASGAYDSPPNVDEYLDASEHKIFEISERRIRQSFHSMPELTPLFSLEMSKEQLVLRMLCSEGRVDSSRARAGFLGERDFPKLAQAAARLSEAPIFIDDSSDTSPIVLKAKCRRLMRERNANLGLIIVDYLQLMRSARPGESREKEIAEISRSLKALAKELKVPVIALSQLNRQVETRPDRRPLLADLRESGAIEQDADVIAFIYRDEMYHRDSKEPGVAEIIISKQRNGPTGTAKLTYLTQFTRFENYAPEEEAFGDVGD